jgi:hypothetical protein
VTVAPKMILSPESVVGSMICARLTLSSSRRSMGLDLALAFLGGVVFGVFRQIAVGARFLDRIDDRGRSSRSAFSSAVSLS